MSSTSRGYHIVAPEYRHNSAGIRALYILADELRARGYRATTGFTARDPDDIVLYPEVCPENVFKSERAVWWLLNDAVVPQPAWAWTEGISNDPLLTVNVIELDLFKPRTGPRSGVVWWAHKGGYSERHVPPGAVRITHDWPPTREELADLIAGAEVLISFDGFTSMNAEAAMLGTPVVCYGSTRKGVEFRIPGVAATYKRAAAEVDGAYDAYCAWLPVFQQRIDSFVDKTQEMFT